MDTRAIRISAAVVRPALRVAGALVFHPSVPLAVQRRCLNIAGGLPRLPRSVTRTYGELARRPVLTWTTGGTGPVVLHLHGGGFVVGGPRSHSALAAHLAAACDGTVHLLDYRLAPEHPAPAAEQDVLAATRTLIDRHGSDRVVLSGDSAGGWLALLAAADLRDSGLSQPRHLVLLSPWTDLDVEHTERPWNDPVLSEAWLRMASRRYLGDRPPPPPVDPTGLAPMTVHVGRGEPLQRDALRLVGRARIAGVAATLRVVDGMWHAPHFLAGALREVEPLIADIAAAITAHPQPASTTTSSEPKMVLTNTTATKDMS